MNPYQEDLLGALRLTKDGIKSRDATAFRTCHDQGSPVAAVLAGGYAANLRDTIEMHINTYLVMCDVLA